MHTQVCSQLFQCNIFLAETGEITLVSTAPLTNLALALRLDPSLARKLKQIVIMGGNIEGMDILKKINKR